MLAFGTSPASTAPAMLGGTSARAALLMVALGVKRRKPRGDLSPFENKQGFAARGLSCSLGFPLAT